MALHSSVNIPAPPDAVWALICDWAGLLRWWLTAEDDGLRGPALVECELIGEHGSVPRTRRMTLANGTVTDEQLFYQNDQTRRIFYSKSDDQSVTGYVASTYVDAIEGGGCAVHISSMFDVRDPAGRATAAARFETVYAAMFRGYRRYFTISAAG